jgi:hypothetical protein
MAAAAPRVTFIPGYLVARAIALEIQVLEKPLSEEDLLDFINQAD